MNLLYFDKHNPTSMKTSISSEAPSQLGAKKIAFPQNLTDGRADIRTDINNYKVALWPDR